MMTPDFIEAAKVWAVRHEPIVKYTTALIDGGQQAAIFSSVIRAIADIAADSEPQVTGDVDLMIVQRDLPQAVGLLPYVVSNQHIVNRIRSGDGARLVLVGREVRGYAGNDEIQLLTPYAPIIGRGHIYRTAYTAEAHQQATIVDTKVGLLPLAHLALTAEMYGILQRPEPKADAAKAATILHSTDLMQDPYTVVRAELTGWDARVWSFLGSAGLTPAVSPAFALAA